MRGGPSDATAQKLTQRSRQAAAAAAANQQYGPGGGAAAAANSQHPYGAHPYYQQGQPPQVAAPMSRAGGAGAPPPPLHWQLPLELRDAASSKLLLPSRAALYALLGLPLLLWVAVVGAGCLHWEAELPDGASKEDFEHPLIWFDRHVFRVWGPLLPLLPYLVRVAAFSLRRRRLQPQTGAAAASAPAAPAPLRPAASLAVQAGLLYFVIIVVRIALYVGHVALQRGAGVYLVSDHLLLAASVVACFQSELVLCFSDAHKAELLARHDPGAGTPQVAAASGLVGAVFVLVALYGDMYCTARWYHHPGENLAALGVGGAVFQLPVLLWLVRQARFVPV
ncbi:hypothetical protein HYH02_011118 [Chlamydomonas schloesseri]|uniref:Uncharacterized protein n=1 Tax=Chlamydomonas schloesseri TaxID=2026947 RepID=A0A835W240_9CHLO|nr:hypothetical protein HYH02_011118 [Chlamydomonas schloesseri]|eukprot:KAG2437742.1 hypothetical protein HYH02_011118 [Chlamydomonas schloesseri]